MRIIYREVLGYVEEIDREMRARGRSQSVQPTIDEVCNQTWVVQKKKETK